MNNNEIIQIILNEIERRIKIQDDWIAKGLQGENLAIAVREELKQLLSTIPTIESENPVPNNIEELAEKKYPYPNPMWYLGDDYGYDKETEKIDELREAFKEGFLLAIGKNEDNE